MSLFRLHNQKTYAIIYLNAAMPPLYLKLLLKEQLNSLEWRKELG